MFEQPLTDTAIAEILSRQTEFTGGAGVAMRHREWLQMLGYMEPAKDGSGYRLTEQGMALANATISADKSRTDQTATAVFMARGYKDNPFHRHIARSLANYLSLPEVITAG